MGRKHREFITLKQLSITTDNAGGYTSSDTTVGTYRAEVKNLSANGVTEEGREYLQDAIQFKFRFKEFTIDNIDDYTLTWDSKVYKINSVENWQERDQYLIIIATNET
jgi:head-tail adaptor